MPEELLLINPRRRRRRNKLGRFMRSANPRRRRYRRRNPIAALAANPRHRRRRRRRNPIAALAANPRRRRRRRNPIALANPRRRRYRRAVMRTRRRYRNPRLVSARGLMNALVPAGTGAVGAVLLDLGLQYVPLPIEWQSGWRRYLVVGGGALALGTVGRFIPGVSKKTANLFTLGALTVAAYGLIRGVIVQNFPQLGLSGITEYGMSDLRLGYLNPAPMVTAGNSANAGLSAYMQRGAIAPGGMGAYMRDSLDPVNSLSGVTNDGM